MDTTGFSKREIEILCSSKEVHEKGEGDTSPDDYGWIDELPELPPLPKGDRRIAIMIPKRSDKVEEEDAEETSEES